MFSSLLSGALAYAELGTMNTSSGAEWAYFMDAFGDAPAFLFSWVSTLVLKPSQMAIICLSFAQYAVEAFVQECDPPGYVIKMVACLAIGELGSAQLCQVHVFNCHLIFSIFPQCASCSSIVIVLIWEWLFRISSPQQKWLLF